MIIEQVRIGRTTITFEQDWIDGLFSVVKGRNVMFGLFSVVKGRNVMFVSDNEGSAKRYFDELTGKRPDGRLNKRNIENDYTHN